MKSCIEINYFSLFPEHQVNSSYAAFKITLNFVTTSNMNFE